jgi:hypothetical protein
MAFDGLVLSFPEFRYWVEFYVVREYGTTALYAGFLLGVIGLVLRLLFYQKRLVIALDGHEGGTTVSVDGRSEYYPHLFQDELDRIANALKDRVAEESLRSAEAPSRSVPTAP